MAGNIESHEKWWDNITGQGSQKHKNDEDKDLKKKEDMHFTVLPTTGNSKCVLV